MFLSPDWASLPVTACGVKDLVDVALADAIDAWRTCLPSALGQGTMQ
jgi:hypothetical protein